jgi:hypothetical protein
VAVAAQLAGVPERTLRMWVEEGRLTSRRIRGVIMVNVLEAQELAELQRHLGRLPRKNKST